MKPALSPVLLRRFLPTPCAEVPCGFSEAIMPTESSIAPHRLSTDGPLCELTLHGPLRLEHVTVLTTIMTGQLASHGFVLLLLNLVDAESGGVPPRRHLAQWAQGRAHRIAAALVGGGAIQRTMVMLAATAAQLLRPIAKVHIKHFAADQQAAAKAWLQSCEPQLLASPPHPPPPTPPSKKLTR
jgi:hypothetical protein